MKIGDRIYVHGFVDEIRKDCVIVRNKGGYFGTDKDEIVEAQRTEDIVSVVRRKDCALYRMGSAQRYCMRTGYYQCDDDYCSEAEKGKDIE